MSGKSIVFLRSNTVDPDSRVEKEVNSLIKSGYEVKIVAWDRDTKYKLKESYLELENGHVKIFRFGIPASFGGGIKRNLLPLTIFQICLFKWLFKNRSSYDIIHACDFDTAYTASYCARIFKKQLVYDIFDYYVDAFRVPQIIKRFVERRDHKIINIADGIIICVEKRKEQIKSKIIKVTTMLETMSSWLPNICSNIRGNTNLIKNNAIKIEQYNIKNIMFLMRKLYICESSNNIAILG